MMKAISKIILGIACMGIVSAATAADVDENPPDGRRAVEKILKELGDPQHWPEEGMKIREVGSVETDTTFFHVYCGEPEDSDLYRYIFFDNTPTYLGYYEMKYEPQDVEEGALIVYSEDYLGPENDGRNFIPIGDAGPPGGIQIGSASAEFIKAPTSEEEQATTEPTEPEAVVDPTVPVEDPTIPEAPPEEQVKEEKVAEYRDWHITWVYRNPETRKNETKIITVNAQFVELDNRKNVVLKSAKNGKEATVPPSTLSNEDKEYLIEFLKD